MLTLISPLKSAEGSLTAMLFEEEAGSVPIESSQRTRGTRVEVRSIAMTVGFERNKEQEKTKEWNEEGHGDRVAHGEAADPPETNECMVKLGSNNNKVP